MAKRTRSSDDMFELKWNNYSNSITDEIYNLHQNESLVDLSFCCEGFTIGCHKLIIFACSPVLRKILSKNPSLHPIIYITDIKLPVLQALLKYIYQGEVQISKSDLEAFMKAADSFQIRGLQTKRSPGETPSNTPEVKKRRTRQSDTRPGPSTIFVDTLNPMQGHNDHGVSNLDFEYENESVDINYESTEETKFDAQSAATLEQTVQKLKEFIRSTSNGIEVFNVYEEHGALTEEKRQELSQLVTEFMEQGVVEGGQAAHELIAEATLILFPGTFEEDPKTLAETLSNGQTPHYKRESLDIQEENEEEAKSTRIPPTPEDLKPIRPKLLQRTYSLYQHLIPANIKIQVEIKSGAKASFEVTCPVFGCNTKLKPSVGFYQGRYVVSVFSISRHIKRLHN